MGVDAWTRTEQERKSRERAKNKGSNRRGAGEWLKDHWNGEGKKCACGCGSKGTAFRDGKLYNSKCVGRGSGWDKAGMPQDRTPPFTREHKRNQRRRLKQWEQ